MPSTRESLLERARSIGPELRGFGEEGERDGRLPEAALKLIRDGGFHRLFVPSARGGLEVDPITHALVQEEVSYADSAAGWSMMIAASSAWWSSRLPRQGAAEIFAEGPDLLAAVAFNPPADATAVDGGYRISGRRAFASCSHAARWMWVTALVPSGDQPSVIGAFFPAEDARIIDTWDAMGMRGTDSNDIELDDVFVPASHTFAIPPSTQVAPGFEGPLYRAPAMLTLGAYLPAVGLGVARRAIEEVRSLAAGKTPFSSATTLRDRALAQAAVGEAEAVFRSARLLLHDALAEGWDRTCRGDSFSLHDKGALLMAATHAAQASAKVAGIMFDVSGTTGVYKRSPIERSFRDAQVVKQHGFVSASRYATVGQVLLGAEPDLGFVHF